MSKKNEPTNKKVIQTNIEKSNKGMGFITENISNESIDANNTVRSFFAAPSKTASAKESKPKKTDNDE